jgi:hypothetical protein
MEEVRYSETSVNFNQTTRRHIPADNTLHSYRRENLKISHPSVRIPNPWRTVSYRGVATALVPEVVAI